jgi:pimeloyl-ACP methyl ester carboxylesterase
MPFLLLLVAVILTPSAVAAQAPVSIGDEWYLDTSDHCRLYVAEYGTGPLTAIVLHGGWGAEHSYLLDALAGLGDRFHFVLYDQRGSLRSPCPESGITVARMVADLDELRASLGESRAILLGHSMGTYLAMAYLAAHPDRVRGLVLLGAVQPQRIRSAADGPLWPALLHSDSLLRVFQDRPEVAAQLHREALDRDEKLLTAWDRTHLWRIRDVAALNIYHIERWRLVRGGRAFFNPAVSRAILRAPAPSDFRRDLARSGCRVQVILGDHDRVDMGGLMWQRQAREIRNLDLMILSEAGHLAWIDQPGRFRDSLAVALDRVSGCP